MSAVFPDTSGDTLPYTQQIDLWESSESLSLHQSTYLRTSQLLEDQLPSANNPIPQVFELAFDFCPPNPAAGVSVLRRHLIQHLASSPSSHNEIFNYFEQLLQIPSLTYVSRYWKLVLEFALTKDDPSNLATTSQALCCNKGMVTQTLKYMSTHKLSYEQRESIYLMLLQRHGLVPESISMWSGILDYALNMHSNSLKTQQIALELLESLIFLPVSGTLKLVRTGLGDPKFLDGVDPSLAYRYRLLELISRDTDTVDPKNSNFEYLDLTFSEETAMAGPKTSPPVTNPDSTSFAPIHDSICSLWKRTLTDTKQKLKSYVLSNLERGEGPLSPTKVNSQSFLTLQLSEGVHNLITDIVGASDNMSRIFATKISDWMESRNEISNEKDNLQIWKQHIHVLATKYKLHPKITVLLYSMRYLLKYGMFVAARAASLNLILFCRDLFDELSISSVPTDLTPPETPTFLSLSTDTWIYSTLTELYALIESWLWRDMDTGFSLDDHILLAYCTSSMWRVHLGQTAQQESCNKAISYLQSVQESSPTWECRPPSSLVSAILDLCFRYHTISDGGLHRTDLLRPCVKKYLNLWMANLGSEEDLKECYAIYSIWTNVETQALKVLEQQNTDLHNEDRRLQINRIRAIFEEQVSIPELGNLACSWIDYLHFCSDILGSIEETREIFQRSQSKFDPNSQQAEQLRNEMAKIELHRLDSMEANRPKRTRRDAGLDNGFNDDSQHGPPLKLKRPTFSEEASRVKNDSFRDIPFKRRAPHAPGLPQHDDSFNLDATLVNALIPSSMAVTQLQKTNAVVIPVVDPPGSTPQLDAKRSLETETPKDPQVKSLEQAQQYLLQKKKSLQPVTAPNPEIEFIIQERIPGLSETEITKLQELLNTDTLVSLVLELEQSQLTLESQTERDRLKLHSQHQMERADLLTKHQEILLNTPADRISIALEQNQRECDSLEAKIMVENQEFEDKAKRALDSKATQQQQVLHVLGVPTFSSTVDSGQMELQRSVLKLILEVGNNRNLLKERLPPTQENNSIVSNPPSYHDRNPAKPILELSAAIQSKFGASKPSTPSSPLVPKPFIHSNSTSYQSSPINPHYATVSKSGGGFTVASHTITSQAMPAHVQGSNSSYSQAYISPTPLFAPNPQTYHNVPPPVGPSAPNWPQQLHVPLPTPSYAPQQPQYQYTPPPSYYTPPTNNLPAYYRAGPVAAPQIAPATYAPIKHPSSQVHPQPPPYPPQINSYHPQQYPNISSPYPPSGTYPSSFPRGQGMY